jgi:hypothetical protein
MNPDSFSESELDALALEVEDQLAGLQSEPSGESWLRGESLESGKLPAATQQKAVIEKATGEPIESFWEKLKLHTRNDICLPSGFLNKQWKSYRDFSSKAALKVVVTAISNIGIAPALAKPVIVAATVLLINNVTNIGLEMFCEGCTVDDEKDTAKDA